MTMYYSRSGWGALPPNRESPPRLETTIVFVHHSAVRKPHTIEEAKLQWAAFQRDHLDRTISDTNPLPWADIAYNLGVGPGVILEGRGWDVKGGGTGPGNKVPHHSGSWDNVSLSVCVLGNYQVDELDDATRESLLEVFREVRERYGDALVVMGDRDVNSTACCGDHLYSELTALWVQSSSLEDDDMPSAQEIAEAMMDELVPVHDYTTGENSLVALRTVEGWKLSELSQIRHALLGLPLK